MAFFTSAQDFFVSNSQSKKFELIQKSYVPRALRFSCQGPSRLREAKRAMGTRMDATVLKLYQAVKAIGREDVAGELESILVPLCTAV